MRDRILQKLNENPLKNVCLIECVKNGDYTLCYFGEDGVIIKTHLSQITMLSSFNNEFDYLLEKLNFTFNLVFTPDEEIAVRLKEKFNLNVKICNQILYNDFEVPFDKYLSFHVVLPTDKNIDFITEKYSLGYSKKGIKDLLEKRFIIYAKYYGEICGFMGMHEEMSLGVLEVFEDYRRKNIGTALIKEAIDIAKQMNVVPYSHISIDNVKSLNLHKKINATFYQNNVFWLSGKN